MLFDLQILIRKNGSGLSLTGKKNVHFIMGITHSGGEVRGHTCWPEPWTLPRLQKLRTVGVFKGVRNRWSWIHSSSGPPSVPGPSGCPDLL